MILKMRLVLALWTLKLDGPVLKVLNAKLLKTLRKLASNVFSGQANFERRDYAGINPPPPRSAYRKGKFHIIHGASKIFTSAFTKVNTDGRRKNFFPCMRYFELAQICLLREYVTYEPRHYKLPTCNYSLERRPHIECGLLDASAPNARVPFLRKVHRNTNFSVISKTSISRKWVKKWVKLALLID